MKISHEPMQFYEGERCLIELEHQITRELSAVPITYGEKTVVIEEIMQIYCDASLDGILEASQEAYRTINIFFINGSTSFETWKMLKDYVLELTEEYMTATNAVYEDGLTE